MKTAPFVIAIAGGSGAGKTTLAKGLANSLPDAALLFHDSYYRDQADVPLEVRERVNYDHPDSLETTLLIEHLTRLKAGESVSIPEYDFSMHTRSAKVSTLDPHRIIILDGILILHEKQARACIDYSFFVSTPADIRFIRRLQRDIRERGRDMDAVINQYLSSVREAYRQFIGPSKQYANQIINGMGGIEETVNHMRHIIQEHMSK